MHTKLDAMPVETLSAGDLLTGHSSASVENCLSAARQENASTRHLVINGDAVAAVDLLPDESIDLIHSSIPYESYISYGSSPDTGLNTAELGAEASADEYTERLCELFSISARKMKSNASMVINVSNSRVGGRGKPGPNGIQLNKRRIGMAWKKGRAKALIRLTDLVADAAESAGLMLRHIEIWQKPHCKPESVRDRSRQVHEYILIFQKTGASKCVRPLLTAAGGNNDSSVFTCPVSRATYGHPASFNPLLPERYIAAMTEPGDLVLDFMGGVGSTALAAMKHGRNSVTIELYANYCDITKARLLHFCEDFKAAVYEPCRFDVFAKAPQDMPIRVESSVPFRPKASDLRFMTNYKVLPRPPILEGNIIPEDPLPMEAFPIDCLTSFQQELLNDLVLSSQANEAVVATSILTAWSAAISRSWEAFDSHKTALDSPNLQSLIIMPSGLGKAVANKVGRPFSRFNRVAARYARLKKRDTVPYLTSDFATGPALIEQLLESNETTFLFSPEAGGLLGDIVSGSKGGAGNLFDLLLKGFSVEELSHRTKKDGLSKLQPCVAMLLLAQLDLVGELMSNKLFQARGLTNRWLVVEVPEPPVTYDRGVYYQSDSEVHKVWESRIRDALYNRLLGCQQTQYHVWSDATLAVFRARHNRIVDRIHDDWEPCKVLLRRSREIHKRITLGLLAAEYYSGNESVLKDDEAIALRVGEFADWFDRRRVEYFYSSFRESILDRKKRTISLLLDCPDYAMTLRDMNRRHLLPEAKLKELVKSFPALFEIKRVKPKGAGRPSKVICLKWSK